MLAPNPAPAPSPNSCGSQGLCGTPTFSPPLPVSSPSSISLGWGTISIALAACLLLALIGPLLCYAVHRRLRRADRAQAQRTTQREPVDCKYTEPIPLTATDGIIIVQPNNEWNIATYSSLELPADPTIPKSLQAGVNLHPVALESAETSYGAPDEDASKKV